LSATSVSGTEVNLTWTNKGANQADFQIERATNSDFTQNLVIESAGDSATSFIDGQLRPGTTYYYRIRAVNAVGNSEYSRTISVTTPTLPVAVANLQVTQVTSSEVDLSWTNVAENATAIEVFRKVGGNTPVLIATLPPTATSLRDAGLVFALKPSTHYIYNVQAINDAGPSPVATVSATTL
jgi:titin